MATKTKAWEKSEPPRVHAKLIRIRFQCSNGPIQIGTFYWSDDEMTFIESVEGEDGVGLYPEDGWKVLGWKKSYIR